MRTFIKTGVVLIVVLGIAVAEANAQGRGRGRGGQQGMRGRPSAGNNSQAGGMQYRYRNGQSGGSAWNRMGQQPFGYGRQGMQGQGRGNQFQQGDFGRGGGGQGIGLQVATPLTQAEKDSLTLMREEEKLARDVYLTLADRWNVPVFSNIAKSESRHMTAVGQLIRANGLVDPITDDTVGAFTNPEFSKLYAELVEAGSRSLADAYGVGVKIEEMDIKDLEESLAQVTSPIVRQVYENLLRASHNHLRAFSPQF